MVLGSRRLVLSHSILFQRGAGLVQSRRPRPSRGSESHSQNNFEPNRPKIHITRTNNVQRNKIEWRQLANIDKALPGWRFVLRAVERTQFFNENLNRTAVGL